MSHEPAIVPVHGAMVSQPPAVTDAILEPLQTVAKPVAAVGARK